MIEPKRARWRMPILPIMFLAAIYLFLHGLRLKDRPLQIIGGLLLVSTAWDLATLWRKRYW
jgi:hypothetical protein